jgi:hypothetical protein
MRLIPTLLFAAIFAIPAVADKPIFSGPQVGERFAPFEAKVVFGTQAGERINVMEDVNDSPLLLIFVHEVTRPSVGLARMLMAYASTLKDKGMKTRLVYLTDDPTDTEAWMKRARSALPKDVTPLVSVDGIEGPGVYGLNRHAQLTVLVGKAGNVTANFPLGQPSVQVDGPKVGHAIVKALGGEKAPTLKEMGGDVRGRMKQKMQPEQDGIYRRMMSPLIQKDATPAEVDKAAKAIEEFAAKNKWMNERVGKASSLIVNGGKLANYGTPNAQAYLKQWAKEYVPSRNTEAKKRKAAAPASKQAAETPKAD